MSNLGHQLLDVPFADMISSLACAIAESQAKLDIGSIEVLKWMGDAKKHPVELPNANGGVITTSMIGAGFQPTFYQFSETLIEVKMTISMSSESKTESSSTPNKASSLFKKTPVSIQASSINAKYTNTYNFNQEGSSLIRTTIVPVPPNPVIMSIIERNAQAALEVLED